MLASARDSEIIRAPKNAYPKYCLKMATGPARHGCFRLSWWQILNANRAPESARFTKNFLVVAPGLIVYDRLLDAFMGKERDGKRDFAASDLATFQDLFIPDAYRDEVFRFVQGAVCLRRISVARLRPAASSPFPTGMCCPRTARRRTKARSKPPARRSGFDPKAVVQSILPHTPGTSQGNDLNVLNRRTSEAASTTI